MIPKYKIGQVLLSKDDSINWEIVAIDALYYKIKYLNRTNAYGSYYISVIDKDYSIYTADLNYKEEL